MNTEYLITFGAETSLCATLSSFKKLLGVHQDIRIDSPDVIIFKNKKFKYNITSGKLSDNSIYYDFTVKIDSIENDEKEYCELLREIRRLSKNISGRDVFELSNAISEYYCCKGYTIIYKLEILMRKLIYKFMAISIGYTWKDESTPKEVIESIRNKTSDINFLREIDFIKLSDFLFKTIHKTNYESLIKTISEKSQDGYIEIQEIQELMPYTNWERFFSKKVNCDSNYLKTRWDKLYDFRCLIAHNKNFSKKDYEDLEVLYNEVKTQLESALNSVDEIHIEQEDRDEIAENISIARGDTSAEFIKLYNLIVNYTKDICDLCSDERDIYYSAPANQNNFLMQVRYLCNNKKLINKDLMSELEELNKFRNIFIHQMGIIEITEQEINNKLLRLKEIISKFLYIHSNTQSLIKLKGQDLRS